MKRNILKYSLAITLIVLALQMPYLKSLKANETISSGSEDIPVSSITVIADEKENLNNDEVSSFTIISGKKPTLDMDAILSDRILGNPDAPITIVEYASLTCGHCAKFHTETMPELKEHYVDTGKVNIIFRDFPLDQMAIKASTMARCAPQEKYFDLIEVLFTNQKRWVLSEDPIKELASMGRLAGLSQEGFDKCLANKDIETSLLRTMQTAQTMLAIRSTPTFIIDDSERLSGAYPFADFKRIIDKQLQGK